MKAPLALVPKEIARLIRKRQRQRQWVAKARAADPEKYRKRVRLNRKRLVAIGYYRKGGKGYRAWNATPKRIAYMRAYNEKRRKACKSAGACIAKETPRAMSARFAGTRSSPEQRAG